MKFKHLFLAFFLLIISCKKDVYYPLIERYHISYLDYPTSVMFSSSEIGVVHLYYNGSRLTKRSGGLVPGNAAIGYDYFFKNDFYDTLIYANNEISIKSFLRTGDEILIGDEEKAILDNKKRLWKKIQPRFAGAFTDDTITYYYNSHNQIIKSERDQNTTKSSYYYNHQSNLDSIVTRYYYNNAVVGKRLEIFDNFDSSNNPFRHLQFFRETFQRSLSLNNYCHYKMTLFNRYNSIVESSERNFSFSYDDLGNIILDN